MKASVQGKAKKQVLQVIPHLQKKKKVFSVFKNKTLKNISSDFSGSLHILRKLNLLDYLFYIK